MTPDAADFLAAIIERPDDDLPRYGPSDIDPRRNPAARALWEETVGGADHADAVRRVAGWRRQAGV